MIYFTVRQAGRRFLTVKNPQPVKTLACPDDHIKINLVYRIKNFQIVC